METTLHPTPRGREVVLEQIRIVGLELRAVAVIAAVFFGVVTVMIAIAIVRGDAQTWFDSDEWIQISVVAFLYPFAVWRRERRFGPAFLWTLPVDRRRLALAKVFAGWVWLIAAVAVLISWQRVLAALSGVPDAETVPLIALTGATATYLLGCALLLALRHPLRWLLGTVGVLFLLGFLNEALGLGPDGPTEAFVSSTGFFSVGDRAVTVWQSLPQPAQWAVATFSWIGAGLAALWAALWRHAERRRH